MEGLLQDSVAWSDDLHSYFAVLPLVLVEEIEQMNSLFQQKQRELVLAMSKVEELTRQLEMLKNGRIEGHHDNQSAVAELDRLYKELQVPGRLQGGLPSQPSVTANTCFSLVHGWDLNLKESRINFIVP